MVGQPKAAPMAEALLKLLRGEEVDPSVWGGGPTLSSEIPGSANIWKLRNACALLHARDTDQDAEVIRILDWWDFYVREFALTEHEDLTPHATYRPWISYPDAIASRIAAEYGRSLTAIKLMTLNRSNIAHLAIGVTPGPACTIDQDDNRASSEPKLIYLDGPLSKIPHYIVQPGKRGLVRDKKNGDLLGLDNLHLVTMLYQAAGITPSAYLTKQCAWQWQVFNAMNRCFDFSYTNIWGFGLPEAQELRNFIEDPDNSLLAVQIVAWMNEHTPSLDFQFIRYVDSSIEAFCEKSGSSSTGAIMASRWSAMSNAVTIASCDSGFRDSGGDDQDVSPQEAFETPTSIVVTDGKESVVFAKIKFPEAYRVRTGPAGARLIPVGDMGPEKPPVVSIPDGKGHVTAGRPSSRRKSLSQKLKNLLRKLKELVR